MTGGKSKEKGQIITLVKSNGIDIDNEIRKETPLNESDFLNEQFKDIDLQSLPIDSVIIPFLEDRIAEIKQSLSANASLAVIFLIGSTLEGLLLGIATKYPALYNRAQSSPKIEIQVKFVVSTNGL